MKKKLLELIGKNKLLVAVLIIAFVVGALLELSEEPVFWLPFYNAE